MQDFKRIKAWQRAHALAIALHAVARRFTKAGYPRLRGQLTSAAESIRDNIVEGCGTSSNKDFARFLNMSIRSANEAEGHLLAARDLRLVTLDEWQKYSTETIEIRRMVFGYRKKVLANDDKPK
jgi:four helix bundle protein